LQHRFFRSTVNEEKILRVFQDVLNGELQIDDVLIVRQHQRFPQHLALDVAAVADFNGAHLIDVDDFTRLDRPRQMPARTRLGGLDILAETQHHAPLAGIDDVKPACHPDQRQHANQQTDQIAAARQAFGRETPSAATAATGVLLAEQTIEALVDAAPDLIEVRRPAGFVAVAVVAPLGIVPCHSDLFRDNFSLRRGVVWRTGFMPNTASAKNF